MENSTDQEILEEIHEERPNFRKVLSQKKLNKFELDKLMAEVWASLKSS
jgi:hypothetical protein